MAVSARGSSLVRDGCLPTLPCNDCAMIALRHNDCATTYDHDNYDYDDRVTLNGAMLNRVTVK